MSERPRPHAAQSPTGCFVRIAWLASNPAIVLLAVLIYSDGHAATSVTSLLFWATVALAIGLRYWEVFHLDGSTLEGQPATRSDWVKYSTRLVPLALAGWIAAIAFG